MREHIQKHLDDVGRLPTLEELSKIARVSKASAFLGLEEFRKEKEKVKAETVEGTTLTKDKSDSSKIIPLSLFILSGVTYILSLYFTGLWFKQMFNNFIAYSISFSMVTYMVISPSLLRKGYRVIIGSTFFIALIFSMGSTIAGQYNMTIVNNESSDTNNTLVFQSLKSEEQEILSYIEELKSDKEVHSNTIIKLSEDRIKNQVYIKTERNKISEYNKKIEVQKQLLKDNRAEQGSLLGEGVKTLSEVDFYSMLAELLDMNKENIRFIIQCLPAIFIDVISALCFNLGLKELKNE